MTDSLPQAELRKLFGDYKAEWLRERVFDLFTEPTYFPTLEGARPCILQGGRGTGKTTVLKGMSYQGVYHFSQETPGVTEHWEFVGLYHRINSNRVAPFRGSELDDEEWAKAFAHYLNLLLCGLIVDYCQWSNATLQTTIDLSATDLAAIGSSLFINESLSNLSDLSQAIGLSLVEFQGAINNAADGVPDGLSVAGLPVDQLTQSLLSLESLSGKMFVFLLDEYENLDANQQRVVNTLIKHSGTTYTFKVGVKEGGLRTRDTTAPGQVLQTPADYASVNITDQLLDGGGFSEFAQRVCNARLSTIAAEERIRIPEVRDLFVGLDADAEAELLGVAPLAASIRSSVQGLDPEESAALDLVTDLEIYVLASLSDHDGIPLADAFRQALENEARWKTRYGNYRQAFLYGIRRRKSGIRKYYCGWETVVQLAAGNIRLLMELVETCFVLNDQAGAEFGAEFSPVLQTKAFQQVGRQNLLDLSSTLDGGRLTRLLLGLGRIFGVLATDLVGHTPEVTQFRIEETQLGQASLIPAEEEACRSLLDVAVMELVLIKQHATKLAQVEDVRDFEYRVHPIFAPFFVFPAGRKRRINLSSDQVLLLASDTREGIRSVLERLKRDAAEPAPEHLALYGDFYGIDS